MARVIDRRRRRLVAIAHCAVLGLAAILPPRQAEAQTAIQAALERHGPVSSQKRAELYQQLQVQAEPFRRQAALLKTVAKLVGPTVVHIEAEVVQRSSVHVGRGHQVEESGSGVLIESGGKHYVLTSRHIVAGAPPSQIKVNLADGRSVQPERFWDDKETDVAVLAISAADLVAARLGNSDELEIGDFVLAVGSPFGLTHSVTFGIISAKGRRKLDLGDAGIRLQDFLQTDAAINPGNSGGPLVNLRGEVIGINTCIASSSGGNEGIGFAIPINMVMFVARQLIERGKVSWAYLGVKLDTGFAPAAAAELGLSRLIGARVVEVTENSPAAAAKLRVGDVVLQIDDVSVEDGDHLILAVNLSQVGKEVALRVFRDKAEVVVRAKLDDRSKHEPQPPSGDSAPQTSPR